MIVIPVLLCCVGAGVAAQSYLTGERRRGHAAGMAHAMRLVQTAEALADAGAHPADIEHATRAAAHDANELALINFPTGTFEGLLRNMQSRGMSGVHGRTERDPRMRRRRQAQRLASFRAWAAQSKIDVPDVETMQTMLKDETIRRNFRAWLATQRAGVTIQDDPRAARGLLQRKKRAASRPERPDRRRRRRRRPGSRVARAARGIVRTPGRVVRGVRRAVRR